MLEVEHNSYKILLPLQEEKLLELLDNEYSKIERYDMKNYDLEFTVTEAQQHEIDKIIKSDTDDRDIIIAINNYLLNIKQRRDDK